MTTFTFSPEYEEESLIAVPYSYGHTVPRECTEPLSPVHNIVSTSLIVATEMPINLEYLHELLPCSSYDRKRFAAITIRLENPKCTALLFTSGKLVITGVKSWYECLLAAICVGQVMNRCSIRAKYWVANCEIQNIVAHSDLGIASPQKLDIEYMYNDLSMECTYQKNMFPGLIYRAAECPVVLLCFYSGKVVLTGGKRMEDIHRGWALVYPIIKRYIK
jgi:transcription initiation factor TFIID TATA-box-binding protein